MKIASLFLIFIMTTLSFASAEETKSCEENIKAIPVAPLIVPTSPFHNPVKEALKKGEAVYGGFLLAPSIENAERIADSSHLVWIDLEHGIFNPESVLNIIRGFHLKSPAIPIIRVPTYNHTEMKSILSTGTLGVVVPEIKTADEVRDFIKRVKYPPEGERGFGPAHSTGYLNPAKSKEALEKANDALLVIVMIETPEAVANIEEIAAVPGIDVLYIGPYDLRTKMGRLAASDPRVLETISKVETVAKAHGIPLGTPVNTGAMAAQKRKEGYQFLTMPSDQEMLRMSIEGFVEGLKEN